MAIAVSKTTKEIRRKANTPDYLIGGKFYDGGDWAINPAGVDTVEKTDPLYVDYNEITNAFFEMSQAQKDAVDSDRLDDLKSKRMGEIDEKTKELIFAGFEYPAKSGDVFSMSFANQLLISNIPATKNMLTYPWGVTTKDNLKTIQIADAIEMDAYYTAAFTHMTTTKASGETLRAQVRASTTRAQIDAIIDNR